MANPKPTICQVLHTLTVGGAEVLADRLARRLADRYRFVFACLDEQGLLGRNLAEAGFTVAVLGRRPGVDLRCMAALWKFWKEQGVDLVHAHQYTPFFYAMAARRLGRRPPVLFTEHGRFWPDYPRRKRMLFNRLVLRRRDRVVGVGEAVRRALITNEGIPADRASVIYNGVDFHLADAADDRAAVRQELGIGPETLLVLQIARLDYLKDHATAIRAIERVAKSRANVRLVLVGDGPERGKIEDEIARRGVASSVQLLGLRTDVTRLLQGADIFVLSSISEGIPVTFLEAMAARLPIVSTNVGGVPEVVLPEQTGMLVPAGDDEAMAESLLRLADDAPLRERLGLCGRERVEQFFSQEQMHAGYQACYEEMLHG